MSAIKVLVTNKYRWQDELVMLNSLTKACRLVNDRLRTRLPIHHSLLELLLFEVDRFYQGQQLYLQIMYKALFAISYYGLLCIGEVMYSTHVIKAKNVHMAINKEKLLLILYLSKTQDEGARPQKIKIVSNRKNNDFLKKVKLTHSYFCPFILM